MAKKSAAKKMKSPPKRVSVRALQREIRGVLKKMNGAKSKKANALRQKLTTFAVATDCGQTLFLDISS